MVGKSDNKLSHLFSKWCNIVIYVPQNNIRNISPLVWEFLWGERVFLDKRNERVYISGL